MTSFASAAASAEPISGTSVADRFEQWYARQVAANGHRQVSSAEGPLDAIHWEFAEIRRDYPGTAMLEVEVRIGDMAKEALTADADEVDSAVRTLTAATRHFLGDAERTNLFDSLLSYRDWEVEQSLTGARVYLNILFREEDGEATVQQLNARLEWLTFAFLLRIVAELLTRGVFVSRDAVRDVVALYEFSAVGTTVFD